MAVDLDIQAVGPEFDLTLNGTVKRGDLLAHNATNWVQADATDATTQLYAQYIAMQAGVSGDIIKGARDAVLYDSDAPYTANGAVYVSGTAGAHTQTRPTTDGDVIQVVGRAISTDTVIIHIKPPEEQVVFYPVAPFNALSTGGVQEQFMQDGNSALWAGADADTAAIATVLNMYFPDNMVSVDAAHLIVNTQAATALDVDFTTYRAYINGSNTVDAGASITAATTTETTADNEIQMVSFLTMLDADHAKAGAPFVVQVDPDAGDFIVVGARLRFTVV